ncbi:hypothetical protein [Paenibacillus sp. Soil522]|uniref:hypothetical protein n=1 Tax=Paenibacillus sp. Soil522 TaxID=1736388 RepID=UPI0006FF1AC5|nr:hypothetical protein [Paenibacillus sp. Soil522]KRE49654.1 hypothetical protein ASG81_04585 [Paenibacillus sp. Soil522]
MSEETPDHDEYKEIYNETSNTVAGVNTPKDNEKSSPLDLVSGAVEEMVDNVQRTFGDNQQPDDEKMD